MTGVIATGLGWARRDGSPYLLAALLGGAGALHFVIPARYASIVPRGLPGAGRGYVYVSGAVELACAAGVADRRTRRAAAWLSAVLFVAVFPANVQMSIDAAGHGAAYRMMALGRLPLQLPLVLWAARVARQQPAETRGGGVSAR